MPSNDSKDALELLLFSVILKITGSEKQHSYKLTGKQSKSAVSILYTAKYNGASDAKKEAVKVTLEAD